MIVKTVEQKDKWKCQGWHVKDLYVPWFVMPLQVKTHLVLLPWLCSTRASTECCQMFGTTSFAHRPNRRESIHVFQQDRRSRNNHFHSFAPDFTLFTLVCVAHLHPHCPSLLTCPLTIGLIPLTAGCQVDDLQLLEFDSRDSWPLGHDSRVLEVVLLDPHLPEFDSELP